MRREKLIIIFAVLLDVIGFGIVIPILPFYVTEFGVSPLTVTILFSTFSFFAFLSSPLLGALSDRFGRRPVLIACIISTAVGWFVFASAKTVWMLFLGRIIDGMAAGNFTTAQSAMVDISADEQERTANLGLVGAVFGVGFLLGPLVGGVLSNVSHSFPFLFAGILASINAVIAFFFFPETNKRMNREQPLSFNPLRPLALAAKNVSLRPLFITWSIFAFAFVTSQSVFGLFTKDVFGMSAFQTGLSFTLVGVVVVVNQGFLLKKFWTARFSDYQIEVMMLAILAAALVLISSELMPLFYLGMIALGTGQANLRVVITTQVTRASDPKRKGETIGILAALMSAYMVAAPIASGMLYEVHHQLPYAVSAAALLIGMIIAMRNPVRVLPQNGSLEAPAKIAE
jgi:DHA1 family tetracycline resistance protein-like MFS transporter